MKKFISLILCAVTFAVSAFCQASYTEKSYSGKVVILREDCVLWNKDAESGKIKWINGESKNVKAGTVYSAVAEVTGTLVTSSGESEAGFYKINSDGKDFYVLKTQSFSAEDAAPVVIVNETVVYKNSSISTFTDTTLEAFSIAAFSEKANSNKKSDFIEVAYFKDWEVKKAYVLNANVSKREADVSALNLIKKAVSVDDKGVKNEFLNNIMETDISDEVMEFAYTSLK